MLTSYKKARDYFDKAWKLVRPPFERVQINYEGKCWTDISGSEQPPGKKFPAVIAFPRRGHHGRGDHHGGGAYAARGMAYLASISPAREARCA